MSKRKRDFPSSPFLVFKYDEPCDMLRHVKNKLDDTRQAMLLVANYVDDEEKEDDDCYDEAKNALREGADDIRDRINEIDEVREYLVDYVNKDNIVESTFKFISHLVHPLMNKLENSSSNISTETKDDDLKRVLIALIDLFDGKGKKLIRTLDKFYTTCAAEKRKRSKKRNDITIWNGEEEKNRLETRSVCQMESQDEFVVRYRVYN